MSDTELLVLAAKAAGMKLVYAPDNGPLRGCQFIDGKSAAWNPLNNDGDALRLASGLKLGICYHHKDDNPAVTVMVSREWHGCFRECHELISGDTLSATRRAIVRAAAEIGKSDTGAQTK